MARLEAVYLGLRWTAPGEDFNIVRRPCNPALPVLGYLHRDITDLRVDHCHATHFRLNFRIPEAPEHCSDGFASLVVSFVQPFLKIRFIPGPVTDSEIKTGIKQRVVKPAIEQVKHRF